MASRSHASSEEATPESNEVGQKDGDGERLSLMNWGHDPLEH